MLLKSEESYIRCKDPARKKVHLDPYHRLRNIHRKAKRIASATAPAGGAGTDICLQLEREVALIVAAYGDDDFATHLENASPHLFTFLRYPGLPSRFLPQGRVVQWRRGVWVFFGALRHQHPLCTIFWTQQAPSGAAPYPKSSPVFAGGTAIHKQYHREGHPGHCGDTAQVPAHKFASHIGMWVFSILHCSISTCNKMHVVPMTMFEMVVTMPGFDAISYGLSVLNPKALPAPPEYVAGVESESGHLDRTAEPYSSETGGAESPQGGVKSGDDTDAAPQPAARPPPIPDGVKMAVRVIMTCFQVCYAIPPDRPRFVGDTTHMIPHPAGICHVPMESTGTHMGHTCDRPPPARTT